MHLRGGSLNSNNAVLIADLNLKINQQSCPLPPAQTIQFQFEFNFFSLLKLMK